MRTFVIAAVAVLALAGAAVADHRFVTHKVPGTFSIDTFTFEPINGGANWEEGTQVRVRMTGVASKMITAGTLKFDLYESYVTQKEASGNLPYFKCNNKGCDTSQGVTLFLRDPQADTSAYTLEFDYEMGKAEKTGVFSLVIWGADQFHTPYDFTVTVDYNYTFIADAAMPALRGSLAPVVVQAAEPAVAAALSPQDVVDAAPAVAMPRPDTGILLPFQWNTTNGNMTINHVYAYSNTNQWEAGAVVTIDMDGVIPTKLIQAGTLKFKIYELGVQYFIDSGNFPYFTCTNKGCNPASGIALHLDNPTSVPTNFTMSCQITIPKSIAGGRNPFNLLLFGVDQDHYPVDFAVSINYNLSS